MCNMHNMSIKSYICNICFLWVYCIFNIFCIYSVQNHALLETLRLHWSNKNQGHISCTRHSLSGTHNTRVICASRHGHLCQRNCKRPIAKTWCLSARLGSLTVHFSSGWITSGSANSCSCSKSIRWQTQACSTMIAPMFLCWKSTMATGNHVIFCIYCIFYIFCICRS